MTDRPNGVRHVGVAFCVGVLYAIAIGALTARTELTANSDGAFLMAAAFSVANGHGFLGFDGNPLAYWPPLYSSLLAVLSVFGIDLRWGTWLVNVFAAFGTMSAIVLWLCMTVDRRVFVALGVISCAALYPLLEIFSEVRPDALFLAFCLLSVVGATAYLRENESGLVYGITFAAFSAITKYQGLAVLGAWVLLILLRMHSNGRRETGRLLMLVALAGAPLATWLIRNFVATHTITGLRPVPSSMSEYMANTLPRVADSVTNWFLPESIPLAVRGPVMIGMLAVLFIVLILVLRRAPSSGHVRVAIFALVGFGVCYFLFTFASSMASSAWGVPRYMSILAPVVVLLVIVALDRLALLLSKPLIVTLTTVVAVILLSVPLVRSAHLAVRIQAGRPGFQYGDWYTAIRPEIRRFNFDGAILSNQGGLVWIITRRPERSIERSTWRKWLSEGKNEARGRLQTQIAAPSALAPVPADRIYFVEILNADQDSLVAADLAEVFHLRPMVQVSDGAIWRLE